MPPGVESPRGGVTGERANWSDLPPLGEYEGGRVLSSLRSSVSEDSEKLTGS